MSSQSGACGCCPVGFSLGVTIPEYLLSRGFVLWGSSYHKITITTKERPASQVTVRCFHQDSPLIIYLRCEHGGGHGRERAGMQIVSPHGVKQQAARRKCTWPTPFPLVAPTQPPPHPDRVLHTYVSASLNPTLLLPGATRKSQPQNACGFWAFSEM